MKKVLSLVCVLILIVGVLPLHAAADVAARNYVDYKGGSLDEKYGSYYTVNGNVAVSANTNLARQNDLIIKKGAVLNVIKGVKLEINGNMQIDNGGKLVVQNGATLVINHEYGYTKIDGVLQGDKGSAIIMKNGNVIVERDGEIYYNGEIKPDANAGKYTVAVLGKITKSKDGALTAKVTQKSDENIILSGFPNAPVISINTEKLRFDKYTKIDNQNKSQLSDLKYLTKLEKLELYGHVQIENLNMLKNLENLKTLDLGYLWVLDISALSEIKSLETLVANPNCLMDNNFKSLKGLTNLKTLDFSRADGYGSIVDANFEKKIGELKKALPNTKIVYGDDIFKNLYGSFYAKITDTKIYPRKFKLCDKNGNIISDYVFCLREVDYFYSSDEITGITQYFDENGKNDYLRSFQLNEGAVVRVYYDYRDTDNSAYSGRDNRIGLKAKEIAAQNPDYIACVYAYRIDMISPAKK